MSVNLSFGGCGFLLAFHVGVAKYFQRKGLVNATSRFAGASGGSLIAASLAYDVPMDSVLSETKYTAGMIYEDLRKHKKFNLSKYVRRHIDTLFPEDLPPCDRLVITTTEVWPTPRTVYWDTFPTKEKLMDCMLLSCHVPLYFDGTPARKIQEGQWHMDGGLLKFIPKLPNHVKVNAFPSMDKNVISPSLLQEFPVYRPQLLKWALFPPSDQVLDQLVKWGEESAEAYDNKTNFK